MVHDYDVAIIGTGTSAYTAAYPLRSANMRVAIIDYRPYGGTCAMRGCQPKKYFVAAADVVSSALNMRQLGLKGIPEISWTELVRSKNTFTETVPDGTEEGFNKEGMVTMHGHAMFTGPNRLRIGDTEISARFIIIATGAKPAILNIPGEEYLTTSEQFMDLHSLPGEILFLGGGYISFEFAHVANMAGSKVTILQRGDRVLKMFDQDLVEKLIKASEKSGIRIKTNTCVRGIRKEGSKYIVYCDTGTENEFETEMVIHGAGRVPDIDNLALEKGEVEYSEKGIIVNGFMQSISNPAVYSVGDATATPYRLAPKADMEGEIAAKNIIHGNRIEADYAIVPSVVFSQSTLSMVGMSEETALNSGKKIKVNKGDMHNWPSSKRIGQKHAAYKVLIDEENDHILGAHILGKNSDETINLFALAMRFNLTTKDLKKMLWAYPTYTSEIKYMIG